VSVMLSGPDGVCHECRSAARHRCSKCRMALFCSANCQRRHFASHRRECDAVAKLELEIRAHFDEQCLIAARLTEWLVARNGSTRVLALQSHLDKYTSDSALRRIGQKALVTSRLLQLLGVPDCKFVSVPFLSRLISLLYTNVIAICDEEELVPIGLALYEQMSLLNHSCAPNCVVAFRGTKALLRPLRAVRAGEPLSIAYIDVIATRAVRQSQLRAQYFFECACEQCCLPPANDYFDARRRKLCEACRVALDAACATCTAVPPDAQRAHDDAMSLADFDRVTLMRCVRVLEAELAPQSRLIRNVFMHAQRLALRAALHDSRAVPYATVLPWALRLLKFERQREQAAVLDALTTKQVERVQCVREASERDVGRCFSQVGLRWSATRLRRRTSVYAASCTRRRASACLVARGGCDSCKCSPKPTSHNAHTSTKRGLLSELLHFLRLRSGVGLLCVRAAAARVSSAVCTAP
jgi:hypothetical protein